MSDMKKSLKSNGILKHIKDGARALGNLLFVKKEKEHSERYQRVVSVLNKYSIAFHAVLALTIVFFVEMISRRSIVSVAHFIRIHPLAYLYNSFIVFASLTLVYLFRKRGFARIVVSSFWVLLGIINGCILSNRVTPFTYTDLKCVSDLLSMTNTNYFTARQATIVVLGFVAFLLFMVVFFIKGPRYTGKKHRIIYPVAVFATLFISIPAITDLAMSNHVVDTYYANIAQGYEDNGFIYSFSSTVIDRGMSRPETYSQETVNRITADVAANKPQTQSSRPNIICILLESVVDPTEIKFMNVNEDPIPTIHSLEQKFTSGHLTVPVVGAGTANTEFEILTGMSMQYFGTGEYPYKTILKQTDSESVASDLSKIGYATHVVHNNGGNFYSRANAFSMMGFDTFASKECMNITKYTPLGSWAADDILVDETIKSLDATPGQTDFTYTITVGTHGDYPKTPVLSNPAYTVSGCADEASANQWTYFVNQLHETDEFVRNLIAKLSERDEDTVVVMFGDHLPTMGLTNEDMASGDIYKTKYWTWNNMGLEKKDADLYAYQLLASTTDSVGIHEGTVLSYHQNSLAAGITDMSAYLSGLEMLQYDLLYGQRYAYNGQNLYPASELVMGTDEVVVENVVKTSFGETVLVNGSGFTPWTRVFINGEKVATTFISDKVLSIATDSIEDGDLVTANILGSSDTLFRSSNEVSYVDPDAADTGSEQVMDSPASGNVIQ